jgi:hypothetical protein
MADSVKIKSPAKFPVPNHSESKPSGPKTVNGEPGYPGRSGSGIPEVTYEKPPKS